MAYAKKRVVFATKGEHWVLQKNARLLLQNDKQMVLQKGKHYFSLKKKMLVFAT
jgi:hypothetical protein